MTAPETPASSSKTRKASAKKAQKVEFDGPILVRWNLAELPSSQHKAGLAGLAICVGYLQRKPDRAGICEIDAERSIGVHWMTFGGNLVGSLAPSAPSA